jgi:hypothetical protein
MVERRERARAARLGAIRIARVIVVLFQGEKEGGIESSVYRGPRSRLKLGRAGKLLVTVAMYKMDSIHEFSSNISHRGCPTGVSWKFASALD